MRKPVAGEVDTAKKGGSLEPGPDGFVATFPIEDPGESFVLPASISTGAGVPPEVFGAFATSSAFSVPPTSAGWVASTDEIDVDIDPLLRVPAQVAIAGQSPLAVPKSSSPTERLHYLETLVRAANDISSTLDPLKVADVLVERAAEILQVPAVAVMLVDERTASVRARASSGLSPEYIQSQSGAIDRTITGRALAEGRVFAAWDLRESPDPLAAEAAKVEGVVSVACAPMRFGGKAVGGLHVYCRETRCFTEDQFHVLSLLAAQGAVALTNARAYKALRSQAAEVRIGFQRVGEALMASHDIGETLRLIVQLAVDMTGADAGAMYMLQSDQEGDGMRLAGMRGLDRRSVAGFRHIAVSPLAKAAIRDKKPISIPDTRQRPDTPFPTLRLSIDETAETRSAVCVPVMVGDRALGVLEQYCAQPGSFKGSNLPLLSTFAHQASVAIETSRLYAQERSIAQTLQRAFLPEVAYSLGGFQIGRIYAPGSEVAAVGGDTYDVFPLPDGRIAALMADVSGQGIYAATLAVMAKYTVRAYAVEDPHPSSVLRRANEAFLHQTDDSIFLTLCYALIDPETRKVDIASAAHPPALLWRARTRTVYPVGGQPGLIAGFMPDQEYGSATIEMETDDILVFYTDGVIEARRNRVMFSQDDRLEKAVAASADLPAQEIASSIYAAVLDYVDGERTDDIALLVLKAD